MIPKFKTGDRVVYLPFGVHGTVRRVTQPVWLNHQNTTLYEVKLDDYDIPFLQATENLLKEEESTL